MSGMAHFFMSVGGSKFHERLAHFFIDIYNQGYNERLTPPLVIDFCQIPKVNLRIILDTIRRAGGIRFKDGKGIVTRL